MSTSSKRIADLVMEDRNKVTAHLRTAVARAQKFYTDWEPLRDVLARDRIALGTYWREIGAEFRMPYREIWLEISETFSYGLSTETRQTGMLIQTDETLQCGEIYHWVKINGREGYPKHPLLSPITTALNLAELRVYFKHERPEQFEGQPFRPGRWLPATLSIKQSTSRTNEEAMWRKAGCEGIDCQYLSGVLVALGLPRTTVEREDLSDVNRRQRRLMRKPRQEFHLVRINFDEIDLIYRRNQGGHHTPRGEHDVRGFYRRLRSGRVSWVRPHKRGSGPTKTRRAGYELIPPVPSPDAATIREQNRAAGSPDAVFD